MMRKIIGIVLAFCVQLCQAQSVSLLNARLDSTINTKITYKTKYIYFKGNTVLVDSLGIKKVQADKKDSSILVTFSDKTQKKIYANEFWGIITDYGERRRFYKGRIFPVWKSYPPYFYRITKGTSDKYYFSESLTDDIYPLSITSLNKYAKDSVAKHTMILYIRENFTNGLKDNNDMEGIVEFLGELINATFDLTVALVQVLAAFVK